MRALHVLAAGVTPQTCICYIQGMLCYNNKKNQKEVPSALKIQTGGYWPLQFLSCLPLFLLLLHLFCLSTAKCSWSHTKENEGHERNETGYLWLTYMARTCYICLVYFIFFYLSHFLFSARFFIKFHYTQIHTYRQMQPV